MNNKTQYFLRKALHREHLSAPEATHLFQFAELNELIYAAHQMRKMLHPDNQVTWIIDRNVNISNVCHAGCLFCNFSCSENSGKSYITTIDEYIKKIDELYELGGRQLLLQGGLHPRLGISFYTDLFQSLKKLYPDLRLHALGPPEIVHIAQLEKISISKVLAKLTEAGLDSLPGAGAEILSDRVRKKLSPGKCSTEEWLAVMHEAHQQNLITSATMMFGHIETVEERIQHLLHLRDLQARKPATSIGFISFIPWTFQDLNTALYRHHQVKNTVNSLEYIRFFALSRLVLHNIPNLQPSWLTVGMETAQICLHGGGNDFGSVMIEENVVSQAGATFRADARGIQNAITEAGFIPAQCDQAFHLLKQPFTHTHL